MSEKKLFILVEDEYDSLFFKKIILESLEQLYSEIEFFEYARVPPEITENIIKSKVEMNFNYLFLTDLDFDSCYPEKKRFIISRIPILRNEKILVVIKEMESWMIAGIIKDILYDLDSKKDIVKSLGIHKRSFCSNDFTKEDFNKLVPRYSSKRLFVMNLFDFYDIKIAMERNSSFKYFYEKYLSV